MRLFRLPVTAIWPKFGRVSKIGKIGLRGAVSQFCYALSAAVLSARYCADFLRISDFSQNALTFLRIPEIVLPRRPVTAIWPNSGPISEIAERRLREAVLSFCCSFSAAILPARYFADFLRISDFSQNILTVP